MLGARVPVVQREEDPADEDERRNQNQVGVKARRLEKGEESITAEVQGRHRQPADCRHTEEAEPQQVCGLLIGLRKHDRHFVTHAGDDPDDAGDRGEECEEPKGLWAVEAGEER